MSANIGTEKLKFSVFGRGYNSERVDSGPGTKESIIIPLNASNAEFDKTGKYCWFYALNAGFKKYDTSTWTEVDQGSIATDYFNVYKPKNNPDGYGIAIKTGSAVLFDLTTNEIINSGPCNLSIGYYECIETSDGYYRFCTLKKSRNQECIYTVDLTDFSIINTVNYGQRGNVGFIDEDSVYSYYPPEWNYQQAVVSSKNALTGNDEWSQQAPSTDNQFKSTVRMIGLAGNDKIYVPTKVNGHWKMGEYDGLNQVNFIVPNYERVFGDFGTANFESKVNEYSAAYNGDKTIAGYATSLGLFITDFNNLYRITDDDTAEYLPLAINDRMILTRKVPKPSGAIVMEVFEF